MTTDSAQPTEYVTLMSGGQGFGIEIRQIREIRRWSPVTALPHALPGVLGVINLRGAVVPILDLAAWLGLGATPASSRNVFVVAQAEGRSVGLLVESVSEIVAVDPAQIRAVPTGAGPAGAHCVHGLIDAGDDMIRVMDLCAVLQPLGAGMSS